MPFDGEPIACLRVPATVASLKLVRRMVREAARDCGCSEACGRDIVIAVDEACQNVIRHAYGEHGQGDVVVDVRRDDDRLVINVVDFAPPVNPSAIHPRPIDELRPGGLGTHFIKECMDRIEFRDPPPGAGNRLWMAKMIE
jgi:sigma-B regulation protein RsbU (phosphoserine phosphatase)